MKVSVSLECPRVFCFGFFFVCVAGNIGKVSGGKKKRKAIGKTGSTVSELPFFALSLSLCLSHYRSARFLYLAHRDSGRLIRRARRAEAGTSKHRASPYSSPSSSPSPLHEASRGFESEASALYVFFSNLSLLMPVLFDPLF